MLLKEISRVLYGQQCFSINSIRNKSIDQKIPFTAREKWMAEEQNLKMNPEWPRCMLRIE